MSSGLVMSGIVMQALFSTSSGAVTGLSFSDRHGQSCRGVWLAGRHGQSCRGVWLAVAAAISVSAARVCPCKVCPCARAKQASAEANVLFVALQVC